LHTTFQQNKDCNSFACTVCISTHTELHTTFQQNKDCNNFVHLNNFRGRNVAYDLPAKQGLQLVLL